MSICRMLVGGAVALTVGFGAAGRGSAVGAQASDQFIFVSVLERGTPVVGLTVDDFIVEEDGQRREILRVEHAAVPMQLAILVDDSTGLTRTLSHVRNGLTELIEALPDGQLVALITFGDHLQTLVDYTQDKARLTAAAAQFVLFSETSAYMTNALVETALDLSARGAIRPVIVLITTEGTNAATARLRAGAQGAVVVSPRGGQGLAFDRVMAVLRDTRVAVHTLVVRDIGLPAFSAAANTSSATRGLLIDQGDLDRAAVLEQLPRVTGGGREELGSTSALAEWLARIVHELANQYILAYARPQALIPPDEIEVSVTSPGMTVRSTPAPFR